MINLINWTEKCWEVGEGSSSTRKRPTGCKGNHFYSLPCGKAEAAFTSPDVILTSPKNSLSSRIDFTVLCYSNSSKNITCALDKLKTELTSPITKSISPMLSDTTFFACCPIRMDWECAFLYNLWYYIPGRWTLKSECIPWKVL